jgi:hypothetical protein
MRLPKTIAIVASLAALSAPTVASAATSSGTGGTAPPSGHSNQSHPNQGRSNQGSSNQGGSSPNGTGGAQYEPPPPPPTGARLENGKAYAPSGAPLAVVRAIRAGNKLQNKPYRYGGGHRSFADTAYDCSGTVSFALHGAKLLRSPLDSGSLMRWGAGGKGEWITVYANAGHTYMVVAGLRLDTSGTGGNGPRWQTDQRDPAGFAVRHPAGL